MTTRFVLDELDLDLPTLPTGLIVVIVVVVGHDTSTCALDAARGLGRVRVRHRHGSVLALDGHSTGGGDGIDLGRGR